jgi:hypothetical protein
MNEMLRERIMRAIAQGAALASAATMLSACSGSDDKTKEPDWKLTERDMATQPDMTTQPDMVTPPQCAETLGALPSEMYPRGAFGGGQYPPNVPPTGAYVVCAPREEGATSCGAPEEGAAWAQAHLSNAMEQTSTGCGTDLIAVGSACGPTLGSLGRDCCYVIEVQVSQCVEGRPFVVEGMARTSSVAARDGWCEVGELRGAELSASDRAMVAEAWAQSGLHEHASVASFGKFMMELMAMGAPMELVAQAAQAIQDEIAHAKVCFDVAASYAGHALAPSPLDITNSVMGRPDDATILAAVIAEGCIGETLSAAQVAAQAAWVSEPALKAALEQIAADEAEHAALAWSFVSWMLAKNPALVPVAQRALRAGFVHPSSPSALGLTAQQQFLLDHGVLPPALETDIRRDAYRSVVMQSAALLPLASAQPTRGSTHL